MHIYFQLPYKFDEEKTTINIISKIYFTLKGRTEFIFYYSEENFNAFKSLNEESGVYLTDEIKLIRQFLYFNRAKKVKEIDDDILYLQWKQTGFETSICQDVLKSIARHLYDSSEYNYILINIDFAITYCRNKILIFRDSKHLNYPDYFQKITFVNNEIELFEWLKTNHIKTFTLLDESKFQKVNKIVKGATVYKEFEEDKYWHLDTLHDYVEYEVYNGNGEHIGTADENGVINREKKVNGRKIEL